MRVENIGDAVLYCGDALTTLQSLPDCSVQTCVTSPPYWGLRDYGVDGQLGLERTPEEYTAKMVEVFREVRRVLRDDGTLWLNLGDSYAGSGRGAWNMSDDVKDAAGVKETYRPKVRPVGDTAREAAVTNHAGEERVPPGLKPKDLVGIPWRVAFALQADGWTLRSEIIWSKLNPMPEPVKDRPTRSHEQIFLFSKAKWTGPGRGQFAHISDADARWLAMFIDTEGNICAKRSERGDTGRMQYGVQVAFANTSRELLESGKNIVGAGSVHERTGKNAPMFYWQLAGQQARDFLHRIYPFLIVKRRQAALGIYIQDVLNTNGKKRPGGFRAPEHTDFLEQAWATMKALNHFGDPDLSDVPEPKYGRWDSQTYHYDAEAIAEPALNTPGGRLNGNTKHAEDWPEGSAAEGRGLDKGGLRGTRNRRTVWTVPTKPCAEAHFATFNPDLITPCILAGAPGGGVVLDPFLGAGTTALTAHRLGRQCIGIELNPEYFDICVRRITKATAQGDLFTPPKNKPKQEELL